MKAGVIISLLFMAFCVLGAVSSFAGHDHVWGWLNVIAGLIMGAIALYEWRRS